MSAPHPSRPSPSPAAPILAASRVARAPKRPGDSLAWQFAATRYDVEVENPARRWPVEPGEVPLADDGRWSVRVAVDERLLYNHPRLNRD